VSWFSAPEAWFARLVFERGLAAIYLIAFAVAGWQFRGLLGSGGLLPIPRYLGRVSLRDKPSLFHFRYSDRIFAVVAWSGAALGAAMVAGLGDGIPLWGAMLAWLVLWALYLSIVNVGQAWYGFGWETLLLETGFLAIFLGNSGTAPPVVLLWLLRWLLLRLEFGAGLIKLRGDRCWRDLTCLRYHHETQPMPGPLSWFFHRLPDPLHRVEVLANYVAQLVAPLVLLAPQPAASAAAAFIIVTQLWLVASGNFAWLNWLTIVIACSVVDTSLAGRLLPAPAPLAPAPVWYEVLVLAYAAGVAALSYRPARNLLSRRQLMNASFDPFHLVNTYGAFGSISRERYELVIEGTADAALGPRTRWVEYEFGGKPGDPRRRPPQVAPYHLRLDWLMWFAALSPAYAQPWLPRLLRALLAGDRDVLRLLRANPFADQPPTWVRVRRYRYRFTTWRERRQGGGWWERTPAGTYHDPVALSRTRDALSLRRRCHAGRAGPLPDRNDRDDQDEERDPGADGERPVGAGREGMGVRVAGAGGVGDHGPGDGAEHGEPDRATDLPARVEHARGHPRVRVGDACQRHQRGRHEHQAKRNTEEHQRPEHPARVAVVLGQQRQPVKAADGADRARQQQRPGSGPRQQRGGGGGADQHHDGERHERQPGAQRGVAPDLLREQGEEEEHAELHGAHAEHDEVGAEPAAVTEDPAGQQGMPGARLDDPERGQQHHACRQRGDDLGVAPVRDPVRPGRRVGQAVHQRGEPGCAGQRTGQVEPAGQPGRPGQHRGSGKGGGDADRHVDEQHPAPGGVADQQAAGHQPDHGAGHAHRRVHAHGPAAGLALGEGSDDQ
jgi:hypothetical protein